MFDFFFERSPSGETHLISQIPVANLCYHQNQGKRDLLRSKLGWDREVLLKLLRTIAKKPRPLSLKGHCRLQGSPTFLHHTLDISSPKRRCADRSSTPCRLHLLPSSRSRTESCHEGIWVPPSSVHPSEHQHTPGDQSAGLWGWIGMLNLNPASAGRPVNLRPFTA